MIQVIRACDNPEPGDGDRFLVDRLWPRGIKKDRLKLEDWLKDLAPSDELRRWFNHDPEKWEEFCRRYYLELDGKEEIWGPIMEVGRRGNVTLVYSAKDRLHNNAVALKSFLEQKISGG